MRRACYVCSCMLIFLPGSLPPVVEPARTVPSQSMSIDDLDGRVTSVSLAPDGQAIVFTTLHGIIGMRHDGRNATLAEKNTAPFLEIGKTLWSGALGADGRTLAVGCGDGTVELWDLAAGQRRSTIKVSEYYTPSLALTPDGNHLVTLSRDIYDWDIPTGHCFRRFDCAGHRPVLVALAPDGKTLAAATAEGAIRLWDFEDAKALPSLRGHQYSVRDLAFAANSKTLVSGGDDGAVVLWKLGTARAQRTFHMPADQRSERPFASICSVAISGDGKIMAAVDELSRVRLWDAATGKELATLTGTTGALSRIKLSHDGKQLALGGQMGRIRFWDTATGKERANAGHHPILVRSHAFSTNSKLMAAVLTDLRSISTVKVWNVDTGAEWVSLPQALARTAKPSYASVIPVPSFSPDGKSLATGYSDDATILWDTANFQERTRLEGSHEVLSTLFSADGKTLAGAGQNQVTCWDIPSGKRRSRMRVLAECRFVMAMSADGKTLVTWGEQEAAQVWDVATGAEKKRFDLVVELRPTRANPPTNLMERLEPGLMQAEGESFWPVLAISPDGKVLASGYKGSLGLWDTITGQPAGTLRAPDGCKIEFVAFSADGKSLVSHDDDGTVRHWDVATRKQLSVVRFNGGKLGPGSLTPDGKTFLTFDQVGAIQLWDIAKLQDERR